MKSAVLSCTRFRLLVGPFARAFLGLPLPPFASQWRLSVLLGFGKCTVRVGEKKMVVDIDPTWTMRAHAPILDSCGTCSRYLIVYNSVGLNLKVVVVDCQEGVNHYLVLIGPKLSTEGLLPQHLSGPVAVSRGGRLAVAHQDPLSPSSVLCMVSTWDIFSNKRPTCVRITGSFEGCIKSMAFDGELLRVGVENFDCDSLILYCAQSSRVINVNMLPASRSI